MSILPNTVCSRCHREYPSIRSRCPYCGTKKPREVRRSMPESDSAVRGTEAARRAAEDMNWQMLIGGILLVCVIAAVIAIVSVNVGKHVSDVGSIKVEDVPVVEAETTAVPAPTPTPTPTATPTPAITSITVRDQWGSQVDGADHGFMEPSGTQIQLEAVTYPLTEGVKVEWSSSDESVATVDENGLVTLTGASGSACTITARAGAIQADCPVWIR